MKRALAFGALALLVTALLVVPLPIYVISPGDALSVAERVDLAHPEDEPSGRLLLTTVRLGRPSAVGALVAWLDDDRAVIPRQRVVPEGVDDAEYFRAQRRLFAESTRLAAAVGLWAAGFEVTISGDGARVAAVLPGSPADGVLRAGDVIVAADGARVGVASDLVSATSRASAGDVTTLTVRRGEQEVTVRIELEQVSDLGRPGLGVAVSTVGHRISLPFDVDVDQGRIGGPSAGLMVALTVYELADDGDLTRGRVIAGTGTIDASGTVGPVGGVAQKVAAAIDEGAEVFLAPAAEVAAARRAAGGEIPVEAVGTFDQAVALLEAA